MRGDTLVREADKTRALREADKTQALREADEASAVRDVDAIRADLGEGHRLSQAGRYAEAEACARRVIARVPGHAMALNNLGYARQMQGDADGAAAAFAAALAAEPGHVLARRNAVLLAARRGDGEAAMAGIHAALVAPGGEQWLQSSLTRAMAERDLGYAATLARAAALVQRGSGPHVGGALVAAAEATPFPVNEPQRRLNTATLRHDLDQFAYMIERGILVDDLTRAAALYRRVLERREAAGKQGWEPLAGDELAEIGATYNRILHLRETPRVERALSGTWNPAQVEDDYLAQRQGLVVVDNFLSPETLTELRAFCRESTVWLANRYAHGRLGALFHSGFNCPLLVQIAEEIRAAFPRMIGDKHTLRQLWGFKNFPFQPGNSTTHADFAAVNVNFWITADEANLEPETGGLIVYDVDAPQHWDFHTYNGRHDVIQPFLMRQGARSVKVPYRANRAMIFNSDLFHVTDTVRFVPDYANRRINITMLYGVRKEDDRRLAKADPLTNPGHNAWRSAAFGGGMRF